MKSFFVSRVGESEDAKFGLLLNRVSAYIKFPEILSFQHRGIILLEEGGIFTTN